MGEINRFWLSRELWLVVLGIFLSYVGYGAVLPFVIIYLHDGRGFSLGVAGLVVGLITGVAVVAAPFAGQLIDRFGARAVAAGARVAPAAGCVGLAFARSPAFACLAATIAGAGNGALNPSQSTLVATLAPAELRHRATAVSRVAANVGGGIGGLVAATAWPGSSRCSWPTARATWSMWPSWSPSCGTRRDRNRSRAGTGTSCATGLSSISPSRTWQ